MNNYLDHSPGTKFKIEGRENLYFGGTSYLGLQNHPQFLQILKDNISVLGSNFGASRKANIRLNVYEDFEDHISLKSGSEAAVSFSSGFLSGLVLSIFFDAPNFQKFYAPNSHPALHSGRTVNATSYGHLKNEVESTLDREKFQPVIFLDTIDFTGNNYPDFTELQELPLDKCILVADDSHGFGIVGEHGFGNFQKLKSLNPKELIFCGSLGKALATPCGIILGDSDRIEQIKATELFGGASPASPAALKTLLMAEALIRKQREKLQRNIEIFKNEITKDFVAVMLKNHPVITYHDSPLTAFLAKNAIITTNFHYPNEDSALISKIVISAEHSENEIHSLTSLINRFYS
ncbi:aminotransferase class I/II-fold pyridoxal phosphate-dependent enzyme [Gramella sp. AN32]|uniref:Aminotransferase class I/II-fold pyridoxal phosphate-dependent enzyme n=1 Tax=Christiangramia antarctica TaxID=2058158 RepID=A0ABW5X6U0_9FLAO|nr:aminotransferase class I/II-fold pyridoxal phosphate-dependent enzyme [Gramella sp. AN32]